MTIIADYMNKYKINKNIKTKLEQGEKRINPTKLSIQNPTTSREAKNEIEKKRQKDTKWNAEGKSEDMGATSLGNRARIFNIASANVDTLRTGDAVDSVVRKMGTRNRYCLYRGKAK